MAKITVIALDRRKAQTTLLLRRLDKICAVSISDKGCDLSLLLGLLKQAEEVLSAEVGLNK